MRDTSRQARECSPKNKEGYIFIIKEKVDWEENHLSHSWVDVRLASLVPPLTLYGLTGTVMVLFKSYVY